MMEIWSLANNPPSAHTDWQPENDILASTVMFGQSTVVMLSEGFQSVKLK